MTYIEIVLVSVLSYFLFVITIYLVKLMFHKPTILMIPRNDDEGFYLIKNNNMYEYKRNTNSWTTLVNPPINLEDL
jgi:hypothetical protein